MVYEHSSITVDKFVTLFTVNISLPHFVIYYTSKVTAMREINIITTSK